MADIGSTAIGLTLGAAEANPIGILTVPLKFVLIDQADRLPDGEKQHAHSVISSLWYGATANNLCVTAAILLAPVTGGAITPICVGIGVITGTVKWQATKDERLFWKLCQDLRLENPKLECHYNQPATRQTPSTETIVFERQP